MNPHLMLSSGTAPQGADILRERLRWTAAERRWCAPPPAARPDIDPWTPGRPALRHGAQLSSFVDTMAFARSHSM